MPLLLLHLRCTHPGPTLLHPPVCVGGGGASCWSHRAPGRPTRVGRYLETAVLIMFDSGASTIPPPPIERCTCECDTDTLEVDVDPELGHHKHGCKCEVHAHLHRTV